MDLQKETPSVVVNPTLPLQNDASSSNSKKKLFIILGIVLLVILIGVFAVFFFSQTNTKPVTQTPTVTPTPLAASQSAIPAPKFTARTYTYSGNLPSTPQLNSYILKSNFTTEEVSSMAAQLGLDKTTPTDTNGFIYGSTENANTQGLLTFNQKTGAFTYESYGNLTPPTFSNRSATIEATDFLKSLGLMDETISCNITYQDKATPGVTYVECHRMWDKLNAPLLNLGGVLNIPETVLISSLTPGRATITTSPTNSSIYNVSNGGNGLARPNEFNTITVGMFQDGRIYSIDSNMRILKEVKPLSQDEMVTSNEAIEYFRKNMGSLSLTVPSGYGDVDFAKVYPNNEAKTDIAAISEITPAYLDKPLTDAQEAYEPYYLIRGTARLESGYTVQFTQSIPATKQSFDLLARSRVSEDNSLQIKTFTPQPTKETAYLPTQPPGQSNPQPSITTFTQTPNPNKTACFLVNNTPHPDKSRQRISFTINVPGYGNITLASTNNEGARTYYFVSNKAYAPSPELNRIRDTFFKAIEEQYVILSARKLLNLSPEGNPLPANNYKNPRETSELVLPPADLRNSTAEGNPNPCTNFEGETCYDETRAGIIINKVTNRMQQVKNDQQALAALAAKQDYFPRNTISSLYWLFLYSPTRSQFVGALPSDYIAKEGEEVQCYISGSSPHIFIHAKNQNVKIRSNAKITFSDPKIKDAIWMGSVSNNNFTSYENITRSSIYYEYDPESVNFTESNEGFIVTKENVTKIIQHMAERMGLTKVESQAFRSDILNEVSKLQASKYIKLSFINDEEIGKQLPLAISPLPNSITRIHIMVKAVNSNTKIQQPEINKVKRSSYSALEIGAFAKLD